MIVSSGQVSLANGKVRLLFRLFNHSWIGYPNFINYRWAAIVLVVHLLVSATALVCPLTWRVADHVLQALTLPTHCPALATDLMHSHSPMSRSKCVSEVTGGYLVPRRE